MKAKETGWNQLVWFHGFLSSLGFINNPISRVQSAYFLMFMCFAALYIPLHLDIFCHCKSLTLSCCWLRLFYLLSKKIPVYSFYCPNNLKLLYWLVVDAFATLLLFMKPHLPSPLALPPPRSISWSWLKLYSLHTSLVSRGFPDIDAVWWFNSPSPSLSHINRSMKSRILATYPDAFPDGSTGEVVDRRPDLEIPH